MSAGGFGAVVPQVKGDWLRVGALLAMQPEGGSNWVLGVVRRVNQDRRAAGARRHRDAVQAPVLSQFAVSGVASASRAGRAAEGRRCRRKRASCSSRACSRPAQNLEIARGGRHHVYMPQAVAERGEDYEIARFREMVREPDLSRNCRNGDVGDFLAGTRSAASGTRAIPPGSRAPAARRAIACARPCGIMGRSVPCAMKTGRSLFAALRSCSNLPCKRQVGRERHHPGQALGVAQRGLQRDRAALRETGQHDLLAGMPCLLLPRDQFFQQALRCADAGLVLRAAAHLQDVVPGAHAHAHVDGHRALRRVREDEAHRLSTPAGAVPARPARSHGRRRPGRAARSPRRAAAGRFRSRWFQAFASWRDSTACAAAALHCSGGAGQSRRETAPCPQEEDNHETYPDGRRSAGGSHCPSPRRRSSCRRP